MSATRSRRAKRNPKDDASYYCSLGKDKDGFDVKYINSFKGRGVFSCRCFQKGEFLIEYRGEVISRREQENRLKVYHGALKVFMFDFKFNGQQLCVDAAREDGSLGRLVNDDETNPNSKMKVTRVDGRPHLCLFAIKDIGPGEEITYNYGDSDWPWRTKISKDAPCQAGEEDAFRSCSTNPEEISRDESCQACDVDTCTSCSRNSRETSNDEPCQAGEMDGCRSSSTNPPEISKDEPCQAGEVDAFSSCSTNPHEISKDAPCQAGEEDAFRSCSTNTEEISRDESCQACDVDTCTSCSRNSQETSNDEPCQAGEMDGCRSSSTNPPEISKDAPCQAGEEDAFRSCSTNPEEISRDESCQACDVDTCTSCSRNSRETSSDEPCQAGEMDGCRSSSTNPPEISEDEPCQAGDVDPCRSHSNISPELSIEMSCQAADLDASKLFSDNSPEDCDHDLIPDEMSSLKKCASCSGPFAPLKWSGVRCKVCYQSWHKKCYVKQMNITELQVVCTEQSSNEETSSEEEYVPDSADDSDLSWNDGSEPLKICHKQMENYEVSTSKYSSKNERDNQESFVEEDRESIYEAAQSLSEDVVSSSQLEVSRVTAKVLNTDAEDIIGNDGADGRAENISNTSSLLRNKTYCYICGKLQTKFTRHLKMHEKTHADVAQVLSLPKKSKQRMKMLLKLRNKGNHSHNSEVLQSGLGSLKLRRTSKKKYNEKDYIHCMYCQGLYLRRDLWRHVRKCSSKPEEAASATGRKKVLSLASMNESALCQQISPGVWNMLAVMKDDEITSTVRSDFCILQLAQSFFNKYGQDPTKYDYIRQRLRESGRLLLALRKEFSIHTLEDAVKPANFDVVIKAVKKVSGYDEEKHHYRTPSLALKLGHSLQKVNDILHCRALMAQDSMLIKSTQSFKTLYSTKWSELISHTALTTLNERHFNKPSTLPFTEDVQRLHRHLEKTTEQALKDLEDDSSPKVYGELCKATMANVILFNRRRGGEISKMTMNGFLERDTSPLHKDVAFGLTEFELRLCQHFSRVEIRGKRGRKVAVLLSPDMVNAITRLIEKREDCGVLADNPFLFARPHCLTPYRGQDCLRVYANECGAENPELLKSTQLRKHVATLSQILNLKNHELDQVANFLGHDIRVHREYYRLPEATTQLAKISKLLLAMEKGSLRSLQGKTLDEIEIEDNLELTDSDAESEGDDEGEVDPDHEVDEGHFTDPQTDCAGLLTRQPVEKPPGMSASLSQAKSKHRDAKGKELNSKLKQKDMEPRRKKNTNKNSASLESARRAKKHPWTPVEVAAVMRHFGEHIKKGQLATMIECEQCKKAEDPALASRSIQNIRDFVRNRGITLKRKENTV